MKTYFSLITFAHSIFALPFAIIGFLLASSEGEHSFNWLKFVLMILCMVFARNAAMAFNRYADRDVDAKNPRTKNREIPAGVLSPNKVLIFTIVNVVLFIICTGLINTVCLWLSPVALFVILGYSLSKRFTMLSHFILGLGLSLAPLGAYLVVSGQFDLIPILFSLSVLTWVSGFDILYALADEEFDRKEGLHSVPAAIGSNKAILMARTLHVCSACFILLAGYTGRFGVFYWIGALFYIFLLIYQHTLVKANDLSRLNRAFFTMNGIASVVFACFFVTDHFLPLTFIK